MRVNAMASWVFCNTISLGNGVSSGSTAMVV